MRRFWLITLLILLSNSVVARTERDTLGAGTVVGFIENLGQWEQPFLYEAQLHDAAMFLESNGIVIALRERFPHPAPSRQIPRHHAYRMTFTGTSGCIPTGSMPQKGYNNYFFGESPARWKSNVKAYSTVRYNQLYPDIDLELFGGSRMLKYNFIVHPGGHPSQIILLYEGTDGVEATSNGSLRIKTTVRDIIELKPYVYQDNGTGEIEVASRWRVGKTKEGYRVSIEVGDYDHRRDLVIDPMLVFSTYTGSTADNWGTTAAYDSRKNVYTAGLVFDVGYPVSLGAYQPSFGGNTDIGIFKFDSTGSQRLFATYLGGTKADMPHSMFVNSFDELLIFGTTGSSNFPVTAGAYQTSHAGGQNLEYFSSSIAYPQGSDIFVSRLSADGTQLQASTYVGGNGNDGLNYRHRYNNSYNIMYKGNDTLYYNYGDGARGEIITDNLNNVYIGSTTFSNDFPVTAGCVQSTLGGRQDGVAFKLDYNLRNLLWSTYLGGTLDDAIYSIDVDSAYNLLVCGGTGSNNFPVTAGAYQVSYGGGSADGFVSKISYGGERLIASTFIGSSHYDQLYFVRTGRHDEVFLFGQTKNSGTSLIYNAGYSVPNAGMLLVRMSPRLNSLRWSTLFGTPGRINLSPTAFAADICNRVYAAGWGRDFCGPYYGNDWFTVGTTGMETSADAYQTATDGQDFYIFSLDANANQLEYASFFGEMHTSGNDFGGGDHVDGGTSRFDRLATLYQSVCASCGGTQNFPTTAQAWSDSNLAGNCNNAIFRFNVSDDFPVAEFVPPPTGCAPYTIEFRNTGRGSSFLWDFGDGTTSTLRNPTHIYTDGGIYTITLIASQPLGCASTDTVRHTLQVIGTNPPSAIHYIACNNNPIQIGPTPQIGASYTWLTSGVSDPTVANPWVSADGTYLLRITTSGCSEVDTFHVRNYILVDQFQTTPVTCRDSADGQASFHLGPSIDPDSVAFLITPPANAHFATGSMVFTGLAAGTYHVTATGYGCSYEESFTLANPGIPAHTKEVVDELCTDSCLGSIHIRYNLADTTLSPALDTLLSGLCPGTYITQLTSSGCPLTDTTVVTRNHALDSLHAWADRYEIYLGESVGLHASSGTSNSSTSYRWSPSDDLDRPNTADPVATPTETDPLYTVTATDGTCSVSDTVRLHCTEIDCGTGDFFIPNAFTPNGDGINDRLCFNADIVTDFHIAVYNRWGQCVYESADAAACWDGTFRNAPCLPGVYTYTCHIRCHNKVESNLKGDITLIR